MKHLLMAKELWSLVDGSIILHAQSLSVLTQPKFDSFVLIHHFVGGECGTVNSCLIPFSFR